MSLINGLLRVGSAPLTISVNDVEITYGEEIPEFSLTYEGFIEGQGVDDITPPQITTVIDPSAGAGQYNLALSGGVADNYELVLQPGTLTIKKAPLEVKAIDLEITYGEAIPELGLELSGFVNGEGESNISLPAIATTAPMPTPAGTYDITLTGGEAANYELLFDPGVLTVNKALLTVTADSKKVIFGESLPELTLTYSGFVNGEDESNITPPALSTTATAESGFGAYEISLTGGSAENYDLILQAGLLEIGKAILRVTAESATMIYGEAVPELGFSYEGFRDGDDVSAIEPPFIRTQVTSNTPAGTYPVELVGGLSNNYIFDFIPGELVVKKAPLLISADDQVVTYGQDLPDFTLSYTGFVNGQDASVLSGVEVSTNAGTTAQVGTYPILVEGGTADNYELEYSEGTLAIEKAVLTVTATDQEMTYGGELPKLALTYDGFVYNEGEQAIELPEATTTAGPTSNAGTYEIQISGGLSNNYAFTFEHGVLTINRAPLTITADDQQMIYGDALPVFTRSYAGLVNDDQPEDLTEPDISTTASSSSNVGLYDIRLSGGASDNYDLTLVEGRLEVNKAPLVATANDQLVTYGGEIPELTIAYDGFKNNDDEGDITAPAISSTVTSSFEIGEYPIALSGGSASNYDLSLVDGTLSVGRALLVVRVEDVEITYGQEIPEFKLIFEGFVADQGIDDITAPEITGLTEPVSDAGDYSIGLFGGTADNYELQLVPGTLTINKARLLVTADTQSITYGEALPELTLEYDGFVNGEDENDLELEPQADTEAEMGFDAGMYVIGFIPGLSNNYEFVYSEGLLIINKATLQATIRNETMTYGADLPEFEFTVTGFVGDDVFETVINDIEPFTTASSTTDVGTYAVDLIYEEPINYELVVIPAELEINKAPLLIKADDKRVTYGSTPPTWTLSYEGFVNEDGASDITLPRATAAVSAESSVGNYDIELNGGAATNYEISLQNGICTVGKATLNVVAQDRQMVYGSELPELIFTYTGFLNDDDETSITTAPTLATAVTTTSSVGSYEITVSGGEATNYEFNFRNGNLQVIPAQLSVLAESQQVLYGEAIPNLTLQYIGFVNDDSPEVLTEQVLANTDADATSSVGSYPITLSGGVAENYQINLFDGTLFISEAPLFAFADEQTMAFGDAVPELTISYEGFKNGDNATDITAPQAETSATSQSPVGSYTITLSGGGADNYQLILQNGSLTIQKARQTITFVLEESEVLPRQTFELTGNSSSGLPLVYTSSDEDILSIEGNVATTLNSGEVTITATQEGDSNHEAALPVSRLLRVRSILDMRTTQEVDIAFPNPASESFQVKEPVDMVELFDKQGNLVKRFVGEFDVYSVRELRRGLYVAFFYKGDQVGMSRIIIWR